MLVGDSKTISGGSSPQKTDPFSSERLVGVRQQHPVEDAEPGRFGYSSRLINNKPNKLPTKVTRDDSGQNIRGFDSDNKLRTESNNYHSAVNLRRDKDLHNMSSSSKLLESPTKLPAIGTPSNRANLKVTWPSVKRSSAGYYESYKNLIESDVTEMNGKDIETENMLLRNALKDMNENLQQRVEKVKHSEFIAKKPEFKDRSTDDQMRTLLKELENNEKLVAINEEEYRRLDSKVQQVSDPNYFYDLDRNVRDIYKQIEEIRRDNKKLYNTSSVTGKNLDRIENITGIPVIMEDALAKEKEIIIIKHKVEDLKAKNDIFKEEKHQKLLKNKKLTEQIKQLNQGHYMDDDSERLAYQYKLLQRKVKAAEEDLKLTKNKQKKFMDTQKGRELEELFNQHIRDRELFKTLDNMIAEQVGVMREMVKSQPANKNRVIEEIITNLTVNLEREEGARQRTAQSFEESKNGVEKTYKSMSPSKGKFSSTQGMGIKGNMYDGLPLFSPETTKSKLIKTHNNKIVVRRELHDQKKPVWKDIDSKNVSKIDLTLIKTVAEDKPSNGGYTPFEGLKKLQKALESGREELQKSARSEKSGNNSPNRSISKMPDSINSSRVEKKEVFKNPKLANLPNLKSHNEEPAFENHEQEHVGLSKKRNNIKPLALKTKPAEDEFDAEDVLGDSFKGVDMTNTERQKKKQGESSGILKSQANSRINSAHKNRQEKEKLNDQASEENIEHPKKKNPRNLETLQKKRVVAQPQEDDNDESLNNHDDRQEKITKKKEFISKEASYRNSPEAQDILEVSARGKGKRETIERETARKRSQNVETKLEKQDSRQASPGKRSDLTIDVDAIEKEHEEVFDFGDEEKKTPVHKENTHRDQDERKTVSKDISEVKTETRSKPKQTRPVENQIKKNLDDDNDGFDDAVDNRMKNLNRKNLDSKPKATTVKKQEDDFEEFEFS